MSSTENADYLLLRARDHGIHNPTELANFMGQMQVECGGFARMSESLNYSGQRLLQVFPGRNGMNTVAEADAIAAGGPEVVANAIYGGQWGKLNLGNTEPGDGWKYHGRGYVQLTGRDNYERVGEALGLDLINHPALAENREVAARIALLYWDARVVAHGHQTDVRAACRDINGGINGLVDRERAAAAWVVKIGRTNVLAAGHIGHGQDVCKLQQDLSDLGYTDAHGHSLKPDGNFGVNTRFAVEAFQRDHHLTVDGKVGLHTHAALDQALKSPHAHAALPLTDPCNADHTLFAQALTGIHRIDADMGRTPDQHSLNLAAALTVAAKQQGLTRIDAVGISADGERTSILQNDLLQPKMTEVATAQAVYTPMEKSSARALALQPAPQPPTQTPALDPHAVHRDATARAY